MIIALGTDHAGFDLKEVVKKFLEENNYEVKDFGAYEYDSADDYPDFINPTAEFVSKNNDAMGIIFGGSGQHNNANILSLAARFIEPEDAINVIKLWLSTEFEGGRHQKRIEKLDS